MVESVIASVKLPVGPVPVGVAHRRMVAHTGRERIFVHVGVHPHPGLVELLMILAARQRSEVIEVDVVDREIALDRFDIPHQRFSGVVRKTDDVAASDDDVIFLPRQHHFAVIFDSVLPFLARFEIVGIDVFQTDEDVGGACRAHLFDKARNFVRHGIDLSMQVDAEPLGLERNEAVDQDFPMLVAGEISSVRKNWEIPNAALARTIFSRSSGVRNRLLRPWTLMIVQNEHSNGQPRPRSKLETPKKFLSTSLFSSRGTGSPARLGAWARWL